MMNRCHNLVACDETAKSIADRGGLGCGGSFGS